MAGDDDKPDFSVSSSDDHIQVLVRDHGAEPDAPENTMVTIIPSAPVREMLNYHRARFNADEGLEGADLDEWIGEMVTDAFTAILCPLSTKGPPVKWMVRFHSKMSLSVRLLVAQFLVAGGAKDDCSCSVCEQWRGGD